MFCLRYPKFFNTGEKNGNNILFGFEA